MSQGSLKANPQKKKSKLTQIQSFSKLDIILCAVIATHSAYDSPVKPSLLSRSLTIFKVDHEGSVE